MMPEILGAMDKEASAMLRSEYVKKGVEFHLNTKVTEVNPKEVIVEKDGETTYEEGCLSVPGIYDTVTRAERVKVEALNEKAQALAVKLYEQAAAAQQAQAGAEGAQATGNAGDDVVDGEFTEK